MAEADIQADIQLAIGALPGVRVFRNTVGFGWQGEEIRRLRTPTTITILRPRPVTFGLAPDSSDLIGWCQGRFLALEVKTDTGRVTPGQQRFIDAVRATGGCAGIVRSVDDALRIINQRSQQC
jgi:hypothetical protein